MVVAYTIVYRSKHIELHRNYVFKGNMPYLLQPQIQESLMLSAWIENISVAMSRQWSLQRDDMSQNTPMT